MRRAVAATKGDHACGARPGSLGGYVEEQEFCALLIADSCAEMLTEWRTDAQLDCTDTGVARKHRQRHNTGV